VGGVFDGARHPRDRCDGISARFADLGGSMLPGSPADLGKLIADDTEKWGKVIWTAHIKAEYTLRLPE
jgi:hypothetical protein